MVLQKKNIFIFLAVNVNPTPLDNVFGADFVKIIFLLIGQGSQPFSFGGFIKGILRGVRCTKSLRVLFLHRRPPSWTTLELYSRAVFIFNEPA
jgi:hypothetical protein